MARTRDIGTAWLKARAAAVRATASQRALDAAVELYRKRAAEGVLTDRQRHAIRELTKVQESPSAGRIKRKIRV